MEGGRRERVGERGCKPQGEVRERETKGGVNNIETSELHMKHEHIVEGFKPTTLSEQTNKNTKVSEQQ